MNLLVVADVVPPEPWHSQHLVIDVAAGMVERGHRVTLACDSAEFDADGSGIRLRLRRAFCHRQSVPAGAMARWGRGLVARAAEEGFDAVLSTSRLVPAPVWMPIGGSGLVHAARVSRRIAAGRPLCADALLGDAKHAPAGLVRALAEWKAASHGRRLAAVHRLVVFGPDAAASARRLTGIGAARVLDAGLCGNLSRPSPAQLAELRRDARRLLRLSVDQVAILVPQTERMDRHLVPVLRAAAHFVRSRKDKAPVLLVVAPDALAVRRAAERAGAEEAVRLLSPTHRFDALLGAADVVAVSSPALGGAWRHGSSGRVIADALMFSRPILAISGAPGQWVIRTGKPSAGMVVSAATTLDWYGAMQTAADPSWRIGAGVAARAVADVLGCTVAHLLDRLEPELAKVSVARRVGRALVD